MITSSNSRGSNCLNRQQFLEPGESVIMISMVKKLQKLTSKKVQLILTNKPKLVYVDPSKLVVKGNIIWSNNPAELNVQVSTPSYFKICTVRFSQPNCYKIFLLNKSQESWTKWWCFSLRRCCHSRTRNKERGNGRRPSRAFRTGEIWPFLFLFWKEKKSHTHTFFGVKFIEGVYSFLKHSTMTPRYYFI